MPQHRAKTNRGLRCAACGRASAGRERAFLLGTGPATNPQGTEGSWPPIGSGRDNGRGAGHLEVVRIWQIRFEQLFVAHDQQKSSVLRVLAAVWLKPASGRAWWMSPAIADIPSSLKHHPFIPPHSFPPCTFSLARLIACRAGGGRRFTMDFVWCAEHATDALLLLSVYGIMHRA